MTGSLSRRAFLAGSSAAILTSRFGALAADPAIRFGYAAITWGGKDRQAIEDVAALGFPGIQLRSNVLAEFGDKPGELRELLAKYKLTMVALSSGSLNVEMPQAEQIARHLSHARFVRDAGGLYLQVTDTRPKGRAVMPADHRALGQLMTELGKRTADLGVPLGYHNHMNSLGEGPQEVDRILEAADSRYVKFELDVAHYLQGGGDPVKAIGKHRKRLLFLHVKDVISLPPTPEKDAMHSYRFVELGKGRVDLPGVFAALKKAKFRGWAVIELDAAPDPARTPKECGEISKRYLQEKLGYTI